MPRINAQRLKQQAKKWLHDGFESLMLEDKSQQSVTLRLETHPATKDKSLVVSVAGEMQTHPLSKLNEVLESWSKKGFVKQLWQISHSKQIKIDARYGKATEVQSDKVQLFGRKNDLLHAGNALHLLKEIGLTTKNGKVQAKSAKKLKQINDFIHAMAYLLEKWQRRPKAEQLFHFADLACGNSYLAFALAWYLKTLNLPFQFTGVDIRQDVIDRSKTRARTLGLQESPCDMSFYQSDVFDFELEKDIDLTVALHACDVATDAVLIKAIESRSKAIVVVPCCQNEVFVQLEKSSSFLTQHSLYRREFATVITDAIRSKVLECFGYKVKVLEFTSSLQTAKSLMIRAELVRGANFRAWQDIESECQQHGIDPKLVRHFRSHVSANS